jgi:ISXO2-like transposase domain
MLSWLACHTVCFARLGGVPADNEKTAISRCGGVGHDQPRRPPATPSQRNPTENTCSTFQNGKEVEKLARRSLDPPSTVVSDGLACFRGVTDAGCTHQPIRTGSGRTAVRTPAFKWVNTALGNIKTAITATYRAIRQKHIPRYLAEFAYRFNRRYDLAAMMPRLGWAAVRTPPMPYRLLKLAEAHA